MGNVQNAISDLEKSLELGLPPDNAQEAQAMLDKMR
jgi:hypothetical protein